MGKQVVRHVSWICLVLLALLENMSDGGSHILYVNMMAHLLF